VIKQFAIISRTYLDLKKSITAYLDASRDCYHRAVQLISDSVIEDM